MEGLVAVRARIQPVWYVSSAIAPYEGLPLWIAQASRVQDALCHSQAEIDPLDALRSISLALY
jgi:hypothetical protein